MAQRKKTKEETERGNLRRSLSRLKQTVADREELWLEVYLEVTLPLSKKDEKPLDIADVRAASTLADYVLDEYEKRWGACGTMQDKP